MSTTSRPPRLLTDPLRHPEASEPAVKDRRAWLIILLTLFLPGSAQVIAGKKGLGRLGLRVFIGFWLVVLIAVVLLLVKRDWLFAAVTSSWLLAVAAVVLIALAILWAVLFVDAFRLIKPPQLSRRMRAATAGTVAVLMVLTSGGLVYGASLVNSQRGLISSIFGGGSIAKPADGRYNVLLMGGDAGKGRVGNRPDSISLVSIDAKTGRSVIFSVPRNLQNIPFSESSPMRAAYPQGYSCGDECLINTLYGKGEEHKGEYPGAKDPGAEVMKDAVSGVTGLEVQYYAMIDLKGFEDLIDAMGGLTITSGKRVPISGPVIPGTDRHTAPLGWIEPGKQKMDGHHALWFARSREGASDYERMVRQRCVQKAMLKQLDPGTLLTRFQKIAGAAPEVVSTDIPEGHLGGFVDLAIKAKSEPIGEAAFVPPLITPSRPDYSKVRAKVEEKIAASEQTKDKNAAGSSGVSAGSFGVPASLASAGPAAAGPVAASNSKDSDEESEASICSVG
ncbi:LCP family protein [Saxibacter everestensis]|uniref:LCP family protein n=1 Tax=Saxibacter everestensis TaxID=2909229 RepID=A0ABY8QQW5_9MICO|nr:LCP family protein [Brevibacteriaceae bacterium ZFBP1038]